MDKRRKIINLVESTVESFIAELDYNKLSDAIADKRITIKEVTFKFIQELESKLK